MEDRQVSQHFLEQLQEAVGTPSEATLVQSRRRVQNWFAQTAPLIQWDVINSPLGSLYIATNARGLCSVDFGVDLDTFLNRLDPRARAEHNPAALVPIAEQLRMYFEGALPRFDFPLDLSQLTPFQQSVLQTIRHIPMGSVWTYGQVAQAIGRPKASRAVGQAVGRNPVLIVIPCHRVITSQGNLGGYSGGGGLASKKLLLRL
ncbi:MAG: hypothetical protein A2Z04_01990, partial [Chloroflexi bacterium RBG_16_57_9]